MLTSFAPSPIANVIEFFSWSKKIIILEKKEENKKK